MRRLTLVRVNNTLVKRATELAADLGLRGGDALYVATATLRAVIDRRWAE